jgi:HAD superfamily hydrolase (TIGR01509 family)
MTRFDAVLFDVGGPLNTEDEHERLVDADIAAALADAGYEVTPEQYGEAVAFAVRSFAPDAHPAIIWHLVGGDRTVTEAVYAGFRARANQREIPFELREGMAEVLGWLHGRGLKLGLAANQPHTTLHVLERHGLGQYFHHREVSGTHGFHKPDVRLFLRACEDLGVEPAQCIMVGDRIDNDVYPANVLGMTTVLFRTGRHIDQQPRSPADVPDAEVRTAADLRSVLESLFDAVRD